MFIKKAFRFLKPFFARLASKLEKSEKVFKNAEFHTDFKSVENVLKKCTKKYAAKIWQKYALFPLLLMFVKLALLITFLVHLVQKKISTDLKSAWNSDTFFIMCQKIFFGHISPFLNCEAKRAKNGAKNKKTYYVNVSKI